MFTQITLNNIERHGEAIVLALVDDDDGRNYLLRQYIHDPQAKMMFPTEDLITKEYELSRYLEAKPIIKSF